MPDLAICFSIEKQPPPLIFHYFSGRSREPLIACPGHDAAWLGGAQVAPGKAPEAVMEALSTGFPGRRKFQHGTPPTSKTAPLGK
jgi:hypothetical protein